MDIHIDIDIDDGVQEVIDGIVKKIKGGQCLTQEEVRHVLYLCRDHTLLRIAVDTLRGTVPARDRTSAYNVLQNAIERHEALHSPRGNPLEELSAQWARAVARASDCAAEA